MACRVIPNRPHMNERAARDRTKPSASSSGLACTRTKAKAPGTRAAYGRAWRPFAVWRVVRGATALPGLRGRTTMALTQRPRVGIFRLAARHNGSGFAVTAMGREADDGCSLRASAQQARCACHIAAVCGRARHDAPSSRRYSVCTCAILRVEHDNHRAHIQRGKFIRFGQGIGRQIDGESVCVCLGYRPAIRDVRRVDWLVTIGPAQLAAIGTNQRAQLGGIDRIAIARQVAGLIVTPRLTHR